ncbi:MFS transporter [Nesterenkonia flava]
MIALLTPLFAALLSISSVMVAIPAIEVGLDADSSALQWVLSGYALAFGIALVPAGRAGDLWGRRGLYFTGVVAFGLTSLLAAVAVDPLMLNVARVLMGLGAGVLMPQIIGMIQELFEGPERGRAYGLMSTVIGLAVATGPLIGGFFVDLTPENIGWRLTFLVNVPIAVVVLVVALLWLPRPDPAPAHQASPRARSARELLRLDPVGLVLLSAGIVLVMLPFIQFRNLLGAALAAAGLLVLAGWTWWEKWLRNRDPDAPMVDLRLFTLPSYVLNSAVLSLYFTAMPPIWAMLTIYLQQGLGHGALLAGAMTLPSAAMILLFSAQVGKHTPRLGPKFLVAGTCISIFSTLGIGASVWLMSTDYGSLWWLGIVLGLNGLSQALIIPAAQTLSMQDVPAHMAGAAGGVAQTAQRIFTAMGLAFVTGIYFAVLAGSSHETAMMVSSAVISLMMTASLATALLAARRARQARRAHQQSDAEPERALSAGE